MTPRVKLPADSGKSSTGIDYQRFLQVIRESSPAVYQEIGPGVSIKLL